MNGLDVFAVLVGGLAGIALMGREILGRWPWQPKPVKLTPDQIKLLSTRKPCPYCGGIHAQHPVACPRLKRVLFVEGGGESATVQEVEYWPTWDQSRVIWLEDILGGEDDNGTA